jgi:ligand-binding sensor domain-containing protein
METGVSSGCFPLNPAMGTQRIIWQHTTILALIAALLLVSCTHSSISPTTLPEVTSTENVNQQTSVSLTALPENFRFDRLTSSDGLSHPYVRDITRDHLGFMWFATTNGLNLYDGYTFTLFQNKPGDKTTLDFDDLRVVYEDTDHIIWVGGGGGVDRFDRSTGKFSRLDEYGQVFCMLESQDGFLWVGFWHGLYAYDRSTGDKRYSFSSKLSSNLDPENNLQGFIRAIDEDTQGNLWLGSDYGLYRLDRETNRFHRYAHGPDEPTRSGSDSVYSVFIDSYGIIWAGTDEGLYRLDRETTVFSHYSFNSEDIDSYSSDAITVILEDESGSLWVGTENGLIYFNPTTNRLTQFLYDPNNQSSLGDNIIFRLFADPTGLIWVGTGNGISIFNPRANQFKVIHSLNRLTNKESVPAVDTASKDFSELGVEAILEDHQGYL